MVLTYRRDIDGMRALAVLGVVAFHVSSHILPGGFAGVDAFFVISGFLISEIIRKDEDAGRFRYANFVGHRVRRIFPALILVLAASLAVGWVLFLPAEYDQLGHETVAGALFTANFHLWQQARFDAGYFDINARLKPLLHLWSLGVEEQFYLIWPPLLLILLRLVKGPGWRTGALAAVACLGLVACIAVSARHQAAAFYFPGTRIWEFGAGALLAMGANWQPRRSLANALSMIGALLVTLSMLLLRPSMVYPGWVTLAPVLGTVFLLLAGPLAFVNRVVLSWRPARYIGRISYPLYLWHWPLLATARIVLEGRDIRFLLVAVVGMAFLLSVLTYHFVELPIRSLPVSLRRTLVLVMVMLGVAATAYVAPDLRGQVTSYGRYAVNDLRWDYLSSDGCRARYVLRHKVPFIFCQTNSDTPKIVLYGDSHANHYYPGFLQQPLLARAGILNLGPCGPPEVGVVIRRSVPVADDPCDAGKKRQIDEFVRHLRRYVPTARYVVLGSRWPTYDSYGQQLERGDPAARWDLGTLTGVPSRDTQQALLEQQLGQTVAILQGQGLKVALLLDTPLLPYEVSLCMDRPFVPALRTCVIPESPDQTRRAALMKSVARLRQAHPGLLVFDPLDALCDGQSCTLRRKGLVLLRDRDHLSVAGSDLVANSFAAWARRNAPDIVAQGP